MQQAEGYLQLGLYEDAWNALDDISSDREADESVLLMRVQIAIKQENWELGVMVANGAICLHPGAVDFYITGAYCIRRHQSLEAAYELLSQAEEDCVQLSALWCYRMACYESQLGRFESVGAHLRKATLFDAELEKRSAVDEDLKPWFESM